MIPSNRSLLIATLLALCAHPLPAPVDGGNSVTIQFGAEAATESWLEFTAEQSGDDALTLTSEALSREVSYAPEVEPHVAVLTANVRPTGDGLVIDAPGVDGAEIMLPAMHGGAEYRPEPDRPPRLPSQMSATLSLATRDWAPASGLAADVRFSWDSATWGPWIPMRREESDSDRHVRFTCLLGTDLDPQRHISSHTPGVNGFVQFRVQATGSESPVVIRSAHERVGYVLSGLRQ